MFRLIKQALIELLSFGRSVTQVGLAVKVSNWKAAKSIKLVSLNMNNSWLRSIRPTLTNVEVIMQLIIYMLEYVLQTK